MGASKQGIYWAAPYAVKCRLASWQARRLERWRYGEAYERLCREIAQRDTWTAEQFTACQRQRLAEVLRIAAARVPYYRRTFAEHGIDPAGVGGPGDLPALPILEKSPARSDPLQLVDEALDRRELMVAHTSGTTGTPLDLYRDVELESTMFAYLDARWHSAAGVSRRHNASVSLGGHLVAAPGRTRPPFWVHNRRWRQLYMSSYHLAPEYLGHYVAEMRRFAADYIEGYPSSLYAVARYLLDTGAEPVRFRAAFVTAETLFDYQREAIGRAFDCRVYSQYGCGEQVVFAAECEAGSLHLSPEIGIVEVVDDDDRPLPAGQTGKLICTSLVNRVQPFIRYRLGDLGSLAEAPCPCGSPLPVLSGLEGRIDAVLITRDGRRIGRLDPVFKAARGIREAQIVQDDYGKFRIRIVPAEGYTDADGKAVAANLAQRTGPAEVRVETVERIERTAAGKFRAVVCHLPDEAKRRPGAGDT